MNQHVRHRRQLEIKLTLSKSCMSFEYSFFTLIQRIPLLQVTCTLEVQRSHVLHVVCGASTGMGHVKT